MSRAEDPSAGDGQGFGERFAWTMAAAMGGLGLFAFGAVVGQGAWFPFVAVVLILAMSYGFRRRMMHDRQRRNETMQDERDLPILARGDRAFRSAASLCTILLAVALSSPPLREALLAPSLRLPGLLLIGLIVANIAGHVAVALAYRRQAP